MASVLLNPPGSATFTTVSIRGGAPRVMEDLVRLRSQIPRNGSFWAVRPAGHARAASSTISALRDIRHLPASRSTTGHWPPCSADICPLDPDEGKVVDQTGIEPVTS